MSSFQDIVEFLKGEHKLSSESCPLTLKDSIIEIRSKLHDSLNSARNRLIEYGIKVFEKQSKNFDKYSIIENDENNSKDVKSKVHDLVASLEGMLKRTELIDNTINMIKELPTKQLLKSNKGILDYKMTRNFALMLESKSVCEIGWLNPQNNTSNSSQSSEDTKKLNVHSTTCYNYFQTNKEFKNEDNIFIEFTTNINQTASTFYFGIKNENVVPSSNCMCCSISNATYFKSNGQLYVNGTSTTENKLNWTNPSRVDYNVSIRLVCSLKKVYFEVNGQGECGPYDLTGTSWTITSGSCGECRGYINIENCYNL